jgi:hypothetical protein
MTAFAKLKMTALLVLVLVGLVTGIGWAGAVTTVRIDDLTEGPPTVTTVPPSIVPAIISIGPEFVHFTLPLPLSGPESTTTYVNLFEGIGGPVSDRLLFTYHADDSFVDVQFASDPVTITLPPGAINQFNNVENGNFVFAGTFAIGENVIYSFQVRSDVADVPGPATLLLLGSGLAALAGATWRRRRRAE